MRKSYNEWRTDPAVHKILKDVIRSTKKSYYRIGADGRHVSVFVKLELIAIGVTPCVASRLLQQYPFPEQPYVYTRKRDANVSAEVREARREKKVQRALAKAAKAEAKAMKKRITAADTLMCQSVEQVETELATVGRDAPEIEPDEAVEDKNHCLVRRGAYWGIYNLKEGGVPRLISKDKAEAVAALTGYSHVKEFCSWSSNRGHGEE
jgi:hypothetical protein